MVVIKLCSTMTNPKRMRCFPLKYGMGKLVVFLDPQQTLFL